MLLTEGQGEVVGVALKEALTLWEPVALADAELRWPRTAAPPVALGLSVALLQKQAE